MKKIKWAIFLAICFFSFSLKINAAGLSVSANAYTVYVGSNVNITANASGIAGQFTFKSNNLAVLSGGGEDWLENSSRTMTFRALKAGTATVTVTPNNVAYSDGSGYYTASKTVTIYVINRPVVTPKSSVNYLSSLSIDGNVLKPEFDKENLEYSVELEAGTTAINIHATPQDSKASVVGAGVRTVTEGLNNIDVVVTAENGSKRTYLIKATVKEKEPIIVYLDNEAYTVIRKKEQLISSSVFYSDTTITINNEEIPAYFGEITGYTLVGLKDSEGIINLYIYDKEDNSYKLYQEVNFSKIVFYPLEVDKNLIPEGYSKDKIVINDIEMSCYKNKQTILLYGVNVENNKTSFYSYDPYEGTIQRYNDKIFDVYKEEIEILKSIIVGLLAIIIVILIVSALQGTINEKNNKQSKFIFKFQTKEEKVKIRDEKNKKKEKIKEAKMLAKELKRKEREEKKLKKKKRRKKDSFDDTSLIDITNINLKKK